MLAGIAASVGLAALLVRFKFHTASEVSGSILLGCAVSLGFIRVAAAMPAPRTGRWGVAAALLALIAIWALTPFPLNQRLIDAALYLSGHDHTYRWTRNWER